MFGQYGFVLSVLVLLSVISDKGLNTYQSRQIAYIKDREVVGKLIGSSLIARVMILLLVIAIAFAISYLIDKPEPVKLFMRFAAMAMGVNFLMGGFSSVLLGYERFILYGILAMFTQLILTIFGFAALISGYGLLGIGIAHLASALIATTIVVISVNKRVCRVSFSSKFSDSLAFLKSSLPLIITAILMAVYYRVDFIMLSLMVGDQAVGYYNSAYALVNGMLMVSTSFSAVILPRLTGYFNTDKESMHNVYQTGFKYLMYFGMAVALGISFIARPVYEFIYPESYLPGVISLKILIWALVLMFLNAIQSSYFIASNWKSWLMYITAAGATLNILLNLYLIPRYSYQGAALATLVSEFLTSVCFFVVIGREIKIGNIARYFCRLIPSLLVMAIVLGFIDGYNLILRVVAAGLSFFLSLIIFRGLNRQDFGFLLQLISSPKNNR